MVGGTDLDLGGCGGDARKFLGLQSSHLYWFTKDYLVPLEKKITRITFLLNCNCQALASLAQSMEHGPAD